MATVFTWGMGCMADSGNGIKEFCYGEPLLMMEVYHVFYDYGMGKNEEQ